MLGRLRITIGVRTKNVIARVRFFPQNSCIYLNYVLFQDSAIWDSANREDTGETGFGEMGGHQNH